MIVDRAADVRAPSDARDPGVYVWRDLAGRACAYGHTLGTKHWMHWPQLASFQFDDTSPEVVAYPAGPAPAEAIADTFHRMVLPLALQRRGLEALHASAVVVGANVVAFCAVSGTGKSTLAYALTRRAGHPQWSDDAVVIEVGAAGVTAVPLPFDVRLMPEAAAVFATRQRSEHEFQRARPEPPPVSPRESDYDDSAVRRPLGAICILVRNTKRQQETARAEMRRLEGSQALAAVLEHAHSFNLTDAVRKRQMLEHYLDVVDRVPVHEVRFTPGLEHLDTVVDDLSRMLKP